MGGWHIVSPDYFTVLRTPILRGRGITARDARETTPVVVINQALARRLWPNGDPIGARVIVGLDGGPDFADVPREVVGIAGDIRQGRLDLDPRPAVYVPLAQLPDVEMAFLNRNSAVMTWLVRTHGAPHLAAGAVQQALRGTTDAPVARVQSLQDIASLSTVGAQFRIWLMMLFAGAALILAAIGIYGVASYSVQRRTREIGVRLALGATPDGIRGFVLKRGFRSTAAGLFCGLAVAFALARVLARFLFAVDPRDPFVFTFVPCVLAIVALAAVWLPARRATRVEPVRALRMD
jgi:predicted permease